ncbi:Cupin domain containing protein [Purpureocillium lavendulum]|uniref:Cupin domain containing protein n=1 Tax=Purpureocillium lavendulum TaxID=1247861 RepID=A0AB34FMW1_9HYPO|nr:Cupin domain containing protein [Purpureocillium lavendulum]
MSDTEEQSLAFKVYITATGLDEATVIDALCGDDDEDSDNFKVESLTGRSTQAVAQHHRTANNDEVTNSKLFLVFDSTDLEERGALIVSLDEYHGFDDAVRYPPEDANNYISSLSIANEDWYTVRQDVPEQKTDAAPVEWFALYNLLPKARQADFESALLAMNKGVQDIGVDEPDEEGDPDELPKFYKAARAESSDIGQISDAHAAYAEEHGLDENAFAVVDDDYKTKGALIVQVAPERDSFRCKGEVAGEILRWIFVNLMTWSEAKDFAGRQ